MINRLKKQIKKNPRLAGTLAIFIVVILAYFQTVGMYFWQDDNALIFKVQNIEGGAGNFGTGIYDKNSDYRFVPTINYPFYLLFGIEPTGYYIVGILFYFFASVSAFFLAKALTEDKKIAFICALIFASGYIGAESVFRISTSLHTSHMLIFMNLAMYFFVLSFRSKEKRVLYYLLSLALFAYTMETGFIRAHGILFVLLGIELFANFKRKTWTKSILRVLPFIFLYMKWYSDNRLGVWLNYIKQEVIDNGSFQIFVWPLQTLRNIIIPSPFKLPLWAFLVPFGFILFKVRNRLLWVGLVFMTAPLVVPYLTNQGEVFESTHRYLTASIFGFSLFASTLLSELFRRKETIFYLSIFAVILIHLFLLNKEEYVIVKERSIPTRNFYKALTTYVQDLPKGSALFFDVSNDAISRSQFYAFTAVGSMPTTTSIALHYGIDRYDLFLPETFMEVLSLLKEGNIKNDSLFTFFYNHETGLKDTTELTRSSLSGTQKEISVEDLSDVNLKFSSPVEIVVNISYEVLYDKVVFTNDETTNLKENLDYLRSKNAYYNMVTASADSEWRYNEVRNLIDEDVNTAWVGSRHYWHKEKKDAVLIDLKKLANIEGVRMRYLSPKYVPQEYSYLCSLDGSRWASLGNFNSSSKLFDESMDILDRFRPTNCRYVKLEIKKTKSDDSPQIAELEIINTGFANTDFEKVRQIEENPFLFLKNESDLNLLTRYLSQNGLNSNLCVITDKSSIPLCQKFKLIPGLGRSYSFIIPPAGTILKSIEIVTPAQVELIIYSMRLTPLSLSELLKRKYILDFVKN